MAQTFSSYDDFAKAVRAMPENSGASDLDIAAAWAKNYDQLYQPKTEDESNVSRGFKSAMYQLPQLVGGTLFAIGDSIGFKPLADYGLDVYKRNSAVVDQLSKDTDDFTRNWEQGNAGDWLSWLGYAAGYTGGQALQALATGGAGAVAGLAGKGAVTTALKGYVEKKVGETVAEMAAAKAGKTGLDMAAKQAIFDGLGEAEKKALTDAAQQVVARNVAASIGSTAALSGYNLSQEVGQVYPDMVDEVHKAGRDVDATDRMRAWGASALAAITETAADRFNLAKVFGGTEGASLAGRAAREIPQGMLREGGTEAAQTVMERYGAQQDITSPEGVRDIVNSAALGAVGGGMAGGAASLHAKSAEDITQRGVNDIAHSDGIDGATAAAAAAVRQTLALPPPDTVLRTTDAGLAPTMISGPEGIRPERTTDLPAQPDASIEAARFETPMAAERTAQSVGVAQTAQNDAGAAPDDAPTETAPAAGAQPSGAPVQPQTLVPGLGTNAPNPGTSGFQATITPAGEFAIQRTNVPQDAAQLAHEVELINQDLTRKSQSGQSTGNAPTAFDARVAPHEVVPGGSAFVGTAAMVGAKVRFFTPTAGATLQGFRGTDGTIWISTRAKNLPAEVFGHELKHFLDQNFPELSREYDAVAKGFLDQRQLQQVEKTHGATGEAQEEAIANLSGTALAQPEFWPHLKAANPTLFTKLADAVTRFFDYLIGRLKGNATPMAKVAQKQAVEMSKHYAQLIARAAAVHQGRQKMAAYQSQRAQQKAAREQQAQQQREIARQGAEATPPAEVAREMQSQEAVEPKERKPIVGAKEAIQNRKDIARFAKNMGLPEGAQSATTEQGHPMMSVADRQSGESEHHSALQPRDDGGRFNGPPQERVHNVDTFTKREQTQDENHADRSEGVRGGAQAGHATEARSEGLQQPGGVRRGAVVLDESLRKDARADEPLAGLPDRVEVDGKYVTFGPHLPARRAAEAYMKQAGLPYDPPRTYVKIDRERAQRIANEFDRMEHRPDDPEVRRAYAAMIRETVAQWRAIKATGLKVEFIKGNDPYGNPRNAILDVTKNNHLWVFPTDDGFGTEETNSNDYSDHPMLAYTGEVIDGRPLRANDIFRIVHDYFGHVKEGVGFRAEGEENAWQQHAAMFSPLARRALTVETRGQNSWVNFGPYAEFNRTASGADTKYADQKIGLLPEWVSEEGYAGEQSVGSSGKVPTERNATRFSFTLDGIEDLPNRRNWMVLSAEDPGGKKASPEYNAKRTEELKALLKQDGVKFIEVIGKYHDEQNSLIIYGPKVDDEFAEALRERFGQESVLIPEGLLYADGKLDPATGESKRAPAADDYYTLLPDGTKWQYGIDFDRPTTLDEYRRAGVKLSVADPDEEEAGRILPTAKKIAATLRHKPITENTPQSMRYLVRKVREIIDAEIATGHGAEHWYRDDMKKSLDLAASVFPEIASNPDARDAFIAALAITSNGLTIAQNVAAAFEVYEGWKEKGRLPELEFVVRGKMIAEALAKYNDLIDHLGPEGAREFLSSKMTVSEFVKMLDSKQNNTHLPVGMEVYGSVLFGPKIGNGFYSNLSGRLDMATMDRWFFRTWGRLTNTLIRQRSSGKSAGQDILAEDKIAAYERDFAQQMMERVVAEERAAGRDLTVADAQAILWYAEKKLYDSYGANNATAQPTSYSIEIGKYVDANFPDRAVARSAESGGGRAAEGQARSEGTAGVASEAPDASIQFSVAAGPAESADRSGAGRDGSVAVTGIHYGKHEVAALSGRAFGSGIRGAERERLQYATDPRIKRRIYFYVGEKGLGLPPPEHGLGPWVYRANLSNLYERGVSPALTFARSDDPGENANRFESAVLDAGYDGYVNRGQFPAAVAVVLNKDIRPELLGNRAQQKMEIAKPQEYVATRPRPKFSIDDSADEYFEGAPAPEDDTIGSVQTTSQKIGEDVADYRKTERLDRSTATLRALGREWLQVAQDRSLFRYKDTIDSDLENVAYDMSGGAVRVKGPRPPNKFERQIEGFGFRPRKVYDITTGGRRAYVYEDKDGRVVLNVAALEQGQTKGALVYQIVGQWAANAGKTFIGDPVSITTRALFRRAINMMSSALRIGSTIHLEPHPDQVEAGLAWRKGDDAYNIGSLAAWIRDTLALYAPQSYAHDFDASDPYRGLGAFRPSAGIDPQQAAGGKATQSQVRLTDQLLADVAARPGTADAAAAASVGDRAGAVDSVRGRLVERPQLYSVADPFYSELARQVEQSSSAAAPAAGWQSFVQGLVNKGLVKKDEVEWSGLTDWLKLQGKKVTKAEVLDFLRNNGVRVEETVLGDDLQARLEQSEKALVDHLVENESFTRRGASEYALDAARGELTPAQLQSQSARTRERADELERLYEQRQSGPQAQERGSTKFHQYQLPGGKNYRELLLTLPVSQAGISVEPDENNVGRWQVRLPNGSIETNFRTRELAEAWADGERGSAGAFHSSHFDQPNILAHVRFNERTDADGRRVLFIEEIQSDWSQAYRKQEDGTLVSKPPPAAPFVSKREFAVFKDGKEVTRTDKDGKKHRVLYGTMEEAQAAASKIDGEAVDLGFGEDTPSWVALTLKRMIRYAVDNGFDRVAWTTGEQQADRYDLSKRVSKIQVEKIDVTGPAIYHVNAFDIGGKLFHSDQHNEEELPGVIGKEMADTVLRMVKTPGQNYEFSGLDLKVGGEGMRAFYDQIVPNVANGVLKKLGGGRVTEVAGITKAAIGERKLDADGNESTAQPKNQGFDITPALREKASGGLPLFSIAAGDVKIDLPRLRDGLLDTIRRDGYLGRILDKTVTTKYNLAKKDADFKRVFDETQAYLDDVSRVASQVADRAPELLPKMHRFTDALSGAWNDFNGKNKRDITAASKALLDGTIEDRVYSDDELKQRGLTDHQVGLYRQARRAVNDSLDRMAVSEMYRLTRNMGVDDVRATIRDMKAADAADALAQALAGKDGAQDVVKALKDKVDRLNGLKATGYFPLMRFGKYAIDFMIKDESGKTERGFLMFESIVQRNAMARALKDAGAFDMQIGDIPMEKYKLFRGLDPNTLELFGDIADLDYIDENGNVATMKLADDEMFQQYLKVAVANRSTMKRLIQRKKVAGFSEDGQRALANLITSNARATSGNYHLYEMSHAAASIDKNKGHIIDEAVKLINYVREGQEEAKTLRGLLFINYLGGSVASALVNMTQPLTMTLPYLSQWGGAAASMKAGLDVALFNKKPDTELAAALKRAEEEGEVEPHEIHNLYAEGNRSFSSDIRVRRALHLWGSMFSAAEAFNRRVTFVAAWQTAQRIKEADPYQFAIDAVRDTQGIYNKGNRPNWARGAVGATVFTFKQYSIAYLEFLNRLPRKQKLIALGILILLSGLQGLPFADDLDDLIDTFGQQLGFNTNSKKWKREALRNTLGKTMGDLMLYGASSIPGAPIDVQGRMSMGNIIPATDLFKKSNTDTTRSALELIGPAGGFGQQLVEGVTQGKLPNFGPVAIQNLLKGADMLQTGMYRDRAGKNVIQTDAYDALAKVIGFQPNDVAQVMRTTQMVNETVKLVREREKEISEMWSEGVALRKPELVREAMNDVRQWNQDNPMSPIRITPSQISRRVKDMLLTREQRLAKTAPKEVRATIQQELQSL